MQHVVVAQIHGLHAHKFRTVVPTPLEIRRFWNASCNETYYLLYDHIFYRKAKKNLLIKDSSDLTKFGIPVDSVIGTAVFVF